MTSIQENWEKTEKEYSDKWFYPDTRNAKSEDNFYEWFRSQLETAREEGKKECTRWHLQFGTPDELPPEGPFEAGRQAERDLLKGVGESLNYNFTHCDKHAKCQRCTIITVGEIYSLLQNRSKEK